MNRQQSFVKRTLAAVLALSMGGNGLAMLAAGQWWYGAVPGVPQTGPFNPHFVKDVGAAYLVVGVAFASLAIRPCPAIRGAALAGAAFLLLHAGVHITEAVGDPHGLAHLLRDLPGVLLPAPLAVWLAATPYRSLETSHAQSPA
jgi:hypothetical protein